MNNYHYRRDDVIEQINMWRMRLGLTYAKLSDMTGLRRQTISDICNFVSVPHLATIDKLLIALKDEQARRQAHLEDIRQSGINSRR